jgi:UDP-galactopyranose mutase
MFFEGYTLKQWKKHPSDLDVTVCGRIPIRTNRDDRYLREKHQVMPRDGYTKMCQRMIDCCGSNLYIRLNTDYQDCINSISFNHLIFTGMIDAYYNYLHGELPYRSLRFELKNYAQQYMQSEMQINYPDVDVPYTRKVEIKHATGQEIVATTVVTEYPADYQTGVEPYYPIPNKDTNELYQKYKSLADSEKHVTFIGRLGTYKYYNMDQCIALAIKACKQLDNDVKVIGS